MTGPEFQLWARRYLQVSSLTLGDVAKARKKYLLLSPLFLPVHTQDVESGGLSGKAAKSYPDRCIGTMFTGRPSTTAST